MVPRWRKAALIVGSAAFAVTGSLSTSLPARAQVAPPGCELVVGNAGPMVSCKYSFTRAAQLFVLPLRQEYVLFDVIGASGGHGCQGERGDHGNRGGAGAEVKGYIVFPHLKPHGREMWVFVGEKGGDAQDFGRDRCTWPSGGFNGGGGGGYQNEGFLFSGGAGGGASDIRSNEFDLNSRLVVAGGGGGGGGIGVSYSKGLNPGGAGGDGGAVGQAGSSGQNGVKGNDAFLGGGGGDGGTLTAGGVGGASRGICAARPGWNGVLAFGGAGAGIFRGAGHFTGPSCGGAGGGGGGGVYGGGGGGMGDNTNIQPLEAGGGGGGGGGSSAVFAQDSGVFGITSGVATPDGNGSVTLSYPLR